MTETHHFEIEQSLAGWDWLCSCGQEGVGHSSEAAARRSARLHITGQ